MKNLRKFQFLGTVIVLLFSVMDVSASSIGASSLGNVTRGDVFSFLGVGCNIVLASESKVDGGEEKSRGEKLPGYTDKPTRNDKSAPTPHYYDDIPDSRGDRDHDGPQFYGMGRTRSLEDFSSWRNPSHPMYRRDDSVRNPVRNPVQVPLHIYDIPPSTYQNPTVEDEDESSQVGHVLIINMYDDED